jgi:adenylyltransferase/sulfurtransferase
MTDAPNAPSRYSRQLLLPELGPEGQARLRAARVLIVGAGGLGCPAAQYLAAAGVGTLGLIDPDRVEITNLHRQILFTAADLGRPKAEAARDALLRLNPEVRIETWTEAFSPENALGLAQAFDLLIDGTDDIRTKYLIDDACLLADKPWIYASVHRFQGQLSVFNCENGPTYRCLFPEPGARALTCEETGVLGVVPGVLGLMQAAEALKWILRTGQLLSGRLKLLDLLTMQEETLRFARNEAEVERVKRQGITPLAMHCVHARGGVWYLDVREPHEQPRLRGEQVLEIPLGQLRARHAEIPRGTDVFVVCQSGRRSAEAIALLEAEFGFGRLRQVAGGIQHLTT